MKNFYLLFLLILLSKITFSQTEPGCPDSLKITTTVCVTANEVRLTGPFWGWDPNGGPIASDNGDGTWTFTFCPAPTVNMEYLLVVDGVQENLVNAPHPDLNGDGFGDLWECSPITDYFSYANRLWEVGSGNVTNTYATCGSCSDFIYGCTDSTATNYNAAANTDDGSCFAPMVNLFFSEYAEGSSNNKYLEIYNPTSNTVDLSAYAFPSVSNGAATFGVYEFWNSFPAGAQILANDVYIIAHPSASPTILAQADHTHLYLSNGDDGYALVYGADPGSPVDPATGGYVIVDFIGDWNADPGTGWSVAGVSNATANHTLVRKCTVTQGNNNWSASAGTNVDDSEWVVLANEEWSDLGFFIPGSTIIYGCTNASACNYDASANTNDGSCLIATSTPTECQTCCAYEAGTWINSNVAQLGGTGAPTLVGAGADADASSSNDWSFTIATWDTTTTNSNGTLTATYTGATLSSNCYSGAVTITTTYGVDANNLPNTDITFSLLDPISGAVIYSSLSSVTGVDPDNAELTGSIMMGVGIQSTSPAANADCSGACLAGYTSVGGACVAVVNGCTDSIACNYNPDANVSDTCIYPPEQPTLACYEEAFYDPEFCEWVVNGDMPEAPPVECYQTATFNADTCVWVVSGAPTVVTDTVSSVGSYEWSINGVTYDTSGTYTFIAPDSVCITYVLIFTSTAGINEELSSQINLFPNPTSGNVIISFPMNEEGNLSVYDTQGKLVHSSALKSGDEINLSQKSPGVYTFKINLNDKIHIQRIIKN